MNLSGKKVFCTGGAGFLGTWLAKALLERGATVQTVRSEDCDLRIADEAKRAVDLLEPDLIIHAAARVGGILANKRKPYQFGRDNLLIGMNVIDAAAQCKTPKVVLIGSTCSYPLVPSTFPFSEESLWENYPEKTNAPYGVAKRTLSTMLEAAIEEGRLISGTTAILANMYGPGDNFDPETSHTIPALIRRMCHAVDTGATEITNWGTGRATRDFLHVRDAAEGICRIAESWDAPAPVNLGTSKEVSIRELADLIAEIVGFKGAIRWSPNDGLDGQQNRALDCTRAWNGLGWDAKIDFKFGLQETVSYWRQLNAK